MDIKDLDEKIATLEDEVKTKKERDELLWLKKQYRGSDEVIPADLYYQLIKKEKVPFKAYSKIPSLDKIVEGFRPGNLIIVSGPTKQGKTTLCQTLTYQFTNQQLPCLWFSFDTPPSELIERFPEGKCPLFYLPKRNEIEKKMDWIESKIIEGIAKFGVKVVFVDHLESIARFSNNAPNFAAELQSISRDLKEMSMRWNVIIFLNHHIRQIDESQVPNWTMMKNSSGPAQESDLTIMVWREKEKISGETVYTNTTQISVQLHRRTGKTGNVKVAWNNNLFTELEYGDQPRHQLQQTGSYPD